MFPSSSLHRHAAAAALFNLVRHAHAGAPQTCAGTQVLSCHNTTAVADTCCFNYPGGSLLQTQFWDTDPVVGPADSWTIHGLWPDHCDGTYDSTCDSARAYTNISDILTAAGDADLLSYMETYWLPNDSTGEEFWEHEWGKHGTCVSTLEPACFGSGYEPTEEVPYYFNTTVALFKSLPTYTWLADAGITPSASETYALSDIQAALSRNHGGESVYVGCSGDAVEQVYYYFNVYGSVANGQFVPASPDNDDDGGCPSTGVRYLPKDGDSSPAPTSTTTTTTGPAPTGGVFSGKGYLNVVTDDAGTTDGCLISGGTWYTTGTCATYTAAASGTGFTLKTSKGYCAVSSEGALTCASSSVSSGDVFTADGTSLANAGDGGSDWYADAVPSGTTQGTIYSSAGSHGTTVQLTWQSV